MYDLTVEEVHTFAVGDGAWVVHNQNCPLFLEIGRWENRNTGIITLDADGPGIYEYLRGGRLPLVGESAAGVRGRLFTKRSDWGRGASRNNLLWDNVVYSIFDLSCVPRGDWEKITTVAEAIRLEQLRLLYPVCVKKKATTFEKRLRYST